MTEKSPFEPFEPGPAPSRPETGRDPAGVPTGPVGWSQDCVHGTVRPSCLDHPLRPLQGLRGPLRCQVTSPRAKRAGWVYPVLPTRYTHPYRTTRPVQALLAVTAMHEYAGRGDTWDMHIWPF